MKPVAVYYSIMGYQAASLRLLHEYFDVRELENPTQDLEIHLRDTHVLFAPLGYSTNRKKIDQCKRLVAIASNTTGDPHIDVSYAKQKQISVVTLKNEKQFLQTITPTAELTLGLIIAITRNVVPAVNSVRNGEWNRRDHGGSRMLSRMAIGIVGYGRLGSLVGKYSHLLGMQVGYFDPYISDQPNVSRYHSLEQLVSESDVVTIHVPHEASTEKLISRKVLEAFKHDSYLVNTSRGELVDTVALVEALSCGNLAGAALDVIDGEFSPSFRVKDSLLWEYARTNKNLIITPHIGGSTIDAWGLTEEHTIRMLIDLFS